MEAYVGTQPPSGGCVLKHYHRSKWHAYHRPAAFGRLCVETGKDYGGCFKLGTQPPSGGCVLKLLTKGNKNVYSSQPPSGGCVLKLVCLTTREKNFCPAAFGRLCVETLERRDAILAMEPSRLRAAVC